MGVAEQVAALPGGGELAGMLRNVSGNPETIRGIATRWRGAAGKAHDHAGRINTAVKDVDEAWQGASADAFATYMSAYGKAGNDLHDALKSSAGSLDTVAQALDTAKSKIGAICGTLLDDVQAYKNQNPEATDADYNKAVSPLVSRATSDARTHHTAAGKAVTTAMNDIRSHLSGRKTTFAAIKAPGDQTFVPAPGHTVDWKPTPLPKYEPTIYQGGAPPGSSGSGAGNPGGGGYSGGGAPPQPLSFDPGTGTGARIVEAAKQHLGKPYVWGANGPSAFDCSGLVYYSLNQAGIKIGDTTAAGYQASGQPVTSPQPGDMVFFGHPAGHVGIYIGDGKMIHAPHPGAQVEIASVAGDSRPVSYRRFT